MGTYEQERREVLDSIFESLCRHPADPDEMAACAYLVSHLTGPAHSAAGARAT